MYCGYGRTIKPPFFEIGPKSYLFGNDILELAKAADAASQKYKVDIIFTTPYCDIRMIANATKHLFVFAPHMDPLQAGRGLADILPESIKAAGAVGVMLNHSEKPLSLSVLGKTIRRADDLGLFTIACADSIAEAKAITLLEPNIIVAEPTDLIGTGRTSTMEYVEASIAAVKSINPKILVLQGAGISSGKDVYRVISAGAEGTGSSSAIAKAADRPAMIDEMICAVREAWDARTK
ncbi:MAG: triose-phosphate isomerase [Spirochaetaceae bacterium]|nr:triose-phosphate isomerase [Spirochaetaceae bacterium]